MKRTLGFIQVSLVFFIIGAMCVLIPRANPQAHAQAPYPYPFPTWGPTPSFTPSPTPTAIQLPVTQVTPVLGGVSNIHLSTFEARSITPGHDFLIAVVIIVFWGLVVYLLFKFGCIKEKKR